MGRNEGRRSEEVRKGSDGEEKHKGRGNGE